MHSHSLTGMDHRVVWIWPRCETHARTMHAHTWDGHLSSESCYAEAHYAQRSFAVQCSCLHTNSVLAIKPPRKGTGARKRTKQPQSRCTNEHTHLAVSTHASTEAALCASHQPEPPTCQQLPDASQPDACQCQTLCSDLRNLLSLSVCVLCRSCPIYSVGGLCFEKQYILCIK